MPGAHDPYAALRLPDYRRLLTGNVLLGLGLEMQALAAGVELYERTKADAGLADAVTAGAFSPALALGLAYLVQFLPVLLLALPAGQAADRFDRKLILMSAQGLAVFVSLGLAALSWWSLPVVLYYPFLMLVGVVRAFNVPARVALVPQLVPAELLPNAVTWNSTGFQIANVSGPALAGLVLYLAEPVVAYLLTALAAVSCLSMMSTVQPRPVDRAREPRSLQSLLAGIRFIWLTRPILASITLDLFAVLLGGAIALLPMFAEEVLFVDRLGLGCLRAAPSAGALCMALILAHRPPMRNAGRTLVIAVAGFGLATIGFGLSTNFYLSFAMLAITGALDNISVVVRGTLIQTLTPDAMRGRVAAVNFIFISSSNELGGFESGLTAHWFGPVGAVVLGGIGTILVVAAVTGLWPPILRLGLVPERKEIPEPAD